MTTTDLAVANQPAAPSVLNSALSIQEIVGQVALIQKVMNAVMKDGEHYGKIPGCGDKPTLLKPGAEKLAMTFRMAPKYEILERDLDGDHREYRATCSLQSIMTGAFLGEGVGSATTKEGKWRFRTGAGETSDVPVPKAYWDKRKTDVKGAAQSLRDAAHAGGLEGEAFGTKKNEDGLWMISTKSDDAKVEHDNPADYYNTVLKMAKKRAFVDAMLTATAASDIFTQDVEDLDLPPKEVAKPGQTPKQQAKPSSKAPADANQDGVNQRQLGMLHSVAEKAGFDEAATIEAARQMFNDQSIQSLANLYAKEASRLIDAIKAGKVKPAKATDRMDDMPGDDPVPDSASSFIAEEAAREAAHA